MKYCKSSEEEYLVETYVVLEEDSKTIEFDDIEHRYIDNLGNIYKTIDDIPENIRHLVKPIKPIKPIKLVKPFKHLHLSP